MKHYDKMTVGELITALQGYPPDARVVVMGYEEGYDDITLVKKIAIEPMENPMWCKGRYDDADPSRTDQAERVILLFGRNAEE